MSYLGNFHETIYGLGSQSLFKTIEKENGLFLPFHGQFIFINKFISTFRLARSGTMVSVDANHTEKHKCNNPNLSWRYKNIPCLIPGGFHMT
jgi:hypothetical protein